MLAGVLDAHPQFSLSVVTQYEEIAQYTRKLCKNNPQISWVCSDDCALGLSHSIRCALEAIPPRVEPDYLLFVVADQPYLQADTVESLADTARTKCPCVACVSSGLRRGNPVLFHSSLISELLQLQGDEGGRTMVKHHEDECLCVPVTDAYELMGRMKHPTSSL